MVIITKYSSNNEHVTHYVRELSDSYSTGHVFYEHPEMYTKLPKEFDMPTKLDGCGGGLRAFVLEVDIEKDDKAQFLEIFNVSFANGKYFTQSMISDATQDIVKQVKIKKIINSAKPELNYKLEDRDINYLGEINMLNIMFGLPGRELTHNILINNPELFTRNINPVKDNLFRLLRWAFIYGNAFMLMGLKEPKVFDNLLYSVDAYIAMVKANPDHGNFQYSCRVKQNRFALLDT